MTETSEALVRAHLDRIAEVNPKLNAAVEVFADDALEAARESDRRRAEGALLSPIDGVPFSVKDAIQIKGHICTAGTLGFRNGPPAKRDATLVARLRAAGAIPIARTNLPDLLFAFESDNLIYGRTNNPHDLTRTSGGSSGGEAALIAANGAPFGLGSDAAGSVRLPAHFCGIAALKPTSGRLPRTGHVPPAGGALEMLWQIGPMARRVEDLQTLLPILLGPDGEDHTMIDMPLQTAPANLRVAYFVDNGIATPDAATVATIRRAAEILGAEECTPPGIDQTYDLEMSLIASAGLREYANSIGSAKTHPLLDAWLAKLDPYRGIDYWPALFDFRKSMYAFLQNYDAILSPVCATPAVPHGASVNDAVFRGFSYTMTYNLTGWPAGTVRVGTSPEGLPIGVQIAAAPFRENIVLTLLRNLES